MAVVDKKSSVFRTADNRLGDPINKAGRMVVITGSVANDATDSSGSKYLLAELPSDSILFELTGFAVSNWGFAQVNIGTRTDGAALVTVAKSAGANVRPIAFGDARHGKRLWEALGLASDPGGVIGLYASATAAASAAGALLFQLTYLTR